MSSRFGLPIVLAGTMTYAAGVHACLRGEEWPGPKEAPPSIRDDASLARGLQDRQPDRAQPVQVPVDVGRPAAAHPRILLTPDRLTALRGLRDSRAPSWQRLAARCDEAMAEPINAGYEAWDWVNATLDLALCGTAANRPEYTRRALEYFRAILDDRNKVGDGEGGDEVVHHDDGYSIRTRGCFGAVAYDWLHDAPGMTDALRKHAFDRFVSWSRWFGESGYNRDQPIANYYVGWFGAVAFAGISGQGDDPRAIELLHSARAMFGSDIVGAYGRKLAGGDFPEGWQYGDMVGAVLAIFADAESRSGPVHPPFDELPWLRQTVAFRAHALWPDGRHMFDTGDWSEKPAVAPAHTMLALATVLPSTDPLSRDARFLARLAGDPAGEEWTWLEALAADPSREADDPRRGGVSYLSSGTATLTARTDWSSAAVWLAMASAPSLSDHQHLDAGHFEIVRGGDLLVADAGGYASYSSLSHNVIAVDDGKANDNYAPSQGTWSDTAGIALHEDDGRFVYALADYTSAYNPAGFPVDHAARSVSRAEREVVFSRSPVPGVAAESARVVIYDRITLTRPSYRATFLLHGAGVPTILRGGGVRFASGSSVAVASTLLPTGATPVVVTEPTLLGDGPYYANDPPEGTTSERVEIRSNLGGLERRFLHAIVVAGRDLKTVSPSPIEGDGVDGVAIDDEAYVFQHAGRQSRASPIAYRAPAAALRHHVSSLAPRGRYAVSSRQDGSACALALASAPGGAASGSGEILVASDAGVVVLDLAAGCSLRQGPQ